MTMTPYNGDLTQSLKWLQNNAPQLQAMVTSKAQWYQRYHTDFWSNWETNVFDLRTCNTFGLMIWCIILNVPADLFGLFPLNNSFAFGNQRQNFTAEGDPNAPTTDPNLPGGNFYGGGNSTLLDLTEVRWALMLRYVTLVSDGRLSFINEMLQFIFNGAQPWDFPNKKYFYVADSTLPPGSATINGMWSNYWEGNQPQYATPRQNYILQSNTFTNASWTANAYSPTASAATGPDGVANSASKLADTSVNGSHSLTQTVSSLSANAKYSMKIFAKASDRNYLSLRLVSASATVNACYANFDLSAGVCQAGNLGTASAAQATITALANGWYCCTLSGQPDTSGAGVQYFATAPLTYSNTFVYQGVTGQGIYIYGAQLEVGVTPTSYIPTTTAAATKTDYSLNTGTGAVTFAVAPVSGAALTWVGGYNQAIVSTPLQFGTGNGTATVFQLIAPGSVKPITTANYMEYRVGANMGLSSQFINLLNSQQYGICPSCAGVKYLVVQET